MPRDRRQIVFLLLASAVALPLNGACDDTADSDEARGTADPTARPEDTLAVVNGTPITELDVHEEMRRRQGRRSPQDPEATLETIIREELIYQKAVELGLDQNPTYRERLRTMEAALATAKRAELGRLYEAEVVRAGAEPNDEDVRDYFDEHAEQFRTQYHVHQILEINPRPNVLEQIQARLTQGEDFDAVAASLSPAVPENAPRPWDMGFLSWDRLPDEWREVVPSLEIGAVSDRIDGPSDRYWWIQVVERRVNEGMTFEAVSDRIRDNMREQLIHQRREQGLRELQEHAQIERTDRPISPLPPPTPREMDEE